MAERVEQQLEQLDSKNTTVAGPQVFVANDGQTRQLFDNGIVLPLGWTGASIRRRTGARLEASSAWPVGDPAANPKPRGVFSPSTWMSGIRDDVKRRRKYYLSDWIDGLRAPGKTIGAVAFLYFAVMAPAVAFGGVMYQVTGGMLGPRDVIMSCGISGMTYSIISGQPMTFPAPTGLTLSFIGALCAFTDRFQVPFMAMYAWCGLWTSAILVILASFNAPGLIRYCTRFTEDVFNSLLGLNFIAEGAAPLVGLLLPVLLGTAGVVGSSARPAADALLAINAAILTSIACRKFNGATRARYFTARARSLVADFGPAITIVGMSALLSTAPARRLGDLARLELGGATGFKKLELINLAALSVPFRFLAAIPALFLAMLFFLDHNISVRTVNSPSNKLVKGEAYNLDLFALGLITGFSSLFGLPWMCSATVQSLNHVRALSTYGNANEEPAAALQASSSSSSSGASGAALVVPKKEQKKNEEKPASAAPDKVATSKSQPLPPPDAIIQAARRKPNTEDKKQPTIVPFTPDGAVPIEKKNATAASALNSATAASSSQTTVAAFAQTTNVAESSSVAALSNVSFAATANSTSASSTTIMSSSTSNGVAKNETSPVAAATTTAAKPTVPKSGGGASAVALLETQKKELSSGGSVGVASGFKILAGAGSSGSSDVSSVVETRVTGFMVHAIVLASLAAAPVLSQVPLAVVWGVFLFLGGKVLAGNQFVDRSKALLVDTKRLDPAEPVERSILELGRRPVLRYTMVQLACLTTLWLLKLNKVTAMIFPSVIAVLLVLRATFIPRVFTSRQLFTLDTEMAV